MSEFNDSHDHEHHPTELVQDKLNVKIPVTILTGFLGAGKTTLLNHLLKDNTHGMRFAVIENELGAATVDDHLVSNSTAIDGEEIIEVTNGCICCNVRGDLKKALLKLYTKVASFDGIIIETTGLADPAPVAQTFFIDEEISELYTLDGIITVVDAKHVLPRLNEKKPDGIVNEAVHQIAFADRVLLNKIDLVDNEEELLDIEGRIKAINSHTPIMRCEQSKIHPKEVINIQAFNLSKAQDFDPDFLEGNSIKHDKSVKSVSCKLQGDLNVNRLQKWIDELISEKAEDLFRYKGVLAVKGMKNKFVFQGVHMLFSGGFSPKLLWEDDDERECRFVFIGRNLNKSEMIEKFNDCEAEEKLRFKVGDVIECNMGQSLWVKGTIIKLWDEGNPYRIELHNEDKSNIWGPEDHNKFVRNVKN